MQKIIVGLGFVFAAAAAEAATISIEVPEASKVEAVAQAYDCDGMQVEAVYHNAGPVSLAVLTIGGVTVAASNVIAASGARYAGAQYVWWVNGDEAYLYDLTKGDDAPPVACRMLAR